MTHDFKRFPELQDSQMEVYYYQSPHKQIFAGRFSMKVTEVHDGDTIMVEWAERNFPFKIRFAGIDTKELSEGGQEAEDWVRQRLEGENIDVVVGTPRVGKFGRLIGTIIHQGLNINEELLQNGLAVPFDRKNEGKIISPIKNIEGVIKWP